MDFLGETPESVLVAREIKKTKGGRDRGQPKHQSGGGSRKNGYYSMVPSGGEYGHLRGSGGRIYLGRAWEGPFGNGSSEITCFFWSQPGWHWVEDLEPLCHLCICPVPSSALYSVHIPPKEVLWDALNVFLKYKEDDTK